MDEVSLSSVMMCKLASLLRPGFLSTFVEEVNLGLQLSGLCQPGGFMEFCVQAGCSSCGAEKKGFARLLSGQGWCGRSSFTKVNSISAFRKEECAHAEAGASAADGIRLSYLSVFRISSTTFLAIPWLLFPQAASWNS